MRLTVGVLSVLALFAGSAFAGSAEVVVPGLGKIVGIATDEVRKFMSVPYAMPPTGERRWKYAEMVQPWAPKVLNATQDPPGCPQDCALPPHTCPSRISEDCLFLNVFSPLVPPSSPLPVMVFIHGGNMKQGYSGGPLYDSTRFANKTGVVVVTINYRLGALGFLSAYDTSLTGGYGVDDQRLALKWVQQYISAFGGDPTKVTIFGQSAGAVSVAYHVSSPESKGLFRGGIAFSDPFTIPFRTPETMNGMAQAVGYYAKCPNDTGSALEQCLRGLSEQEVVAAGAQAEVDLLTDLSKFLDAFFPWLPLVDPSGKYPSSIVEDPLFAFANDRTASKVPLIMGTVSQEAIIFVYEAFGKALPEIEYDALLALIFGVDNAFKIAEKYPLQNKTDARSHVAYIGTRALFICSTRNASMGSASQKRWVYHFNHLASFSDKEWGPMFPICQTHVCHASGLPFTFSVNGSEWGLNFTAPEAYLSHNMETWWSNFAKDLDPGTAQGLTWPAYLPGTEESMILDTPQSVVKNNFTEECDFWDEIGYSYS